MLKKLSPEQVSEILEKLPEDLRGAFFSVETANKISEVCEKYEIPDEKIPFVVNYVGQVLLGIMSPEELEEILKKEGELKSDVARDVAQQIHRYIFFPVKESLSALSGTSQTKVPPVSAPTPPPEERERPEKPDTYREPVV